METMHTTTPVTAVERGRPWRASGVRVMYRVACIACDWMRVVGSKNQAETLAHWHEDHED